ncbi:DgyrCDS10225 [Dimorphilus gyrociliatus]|uniref:DgyrCDS10225 n=1 Tax=Dimorphilus gyrociliatus TaxID=2664684 RepID=A0A7I8VZH9_9ANNE|nr:DgyrCDS10225 [Dimorphilus gyrociliatus]
MNVTPFPVTTSVSFIPPAAVASITERLQYQSLDDRRSPCLSVVTPRPMTPSCLEIVNKQPAEASIADVSPPAPPCKRHCRSLSVPVESSQPLYPASRYKYSLNLPRSSVWHVPSRRRRRHSGNLHSPPRIYLTPRPASAQETVREEEDQNNSSVSNSNSMPTLISGRKKVKKHRSRPSLDFVKVSESAYSKCALVPNLEQIAASPLQTCSSQTLTDSAYSLVSSASATEFDEEASSSRRSDDDLALFDMDPVSDLDLEQIEND